MKPRTAGCFVVTRSSWLPFLLALALAALPAVCLAESHFGATGTDPADPNAGVRIPVAVTDDTVRRAASGTENLISLVGASPDGSAEERYSIGLERLAGGKRLHGNYTLEQLVEALVSARRSSKPLSNVFFCGHITLVAKASMPEVKPVRADEEYLGFMLVGETSKPRCLNYQEQFIKAFDKALADKNLTPGEVFSRDARVSFKVCLTARYCRDFLEQVAARLPEGAVVEAYTVPFVWSTAFQVPLVSLVLGNFDQRFLFGEQAEGLVHLKGKWKPDAGRSSKPVRPRAEAAAGFDGLEAR
jgi:hypothetical protein